MNIFDHNSEDYKMLNLTDFFEDVRKDAINSGYELFLLHGILGMKQKFGSKKPIRLANKLINYFIKFEEYEKCADLKKIIDEYKQIKTNKKEKGYENTNLDTDKRRSKK